MNVESPIDTKQEEAIPTLTLSRPFHTPPRRIVETPRWVESDCGSYEEIISSMYQNSWPRKNQVRYHPLRDNGDR